MILTCIVCPNGCQLAAERRGSEVTVSGNKCPKGKEFVETELLAPKRMLCSTVKTASTLSPVLPVRTDREIPKDSLFDIMREINKVTLKKSVRRGDVIIKDVLNLGADVIASADFTLQEEQR